MEAFGSTQDSVINSALGSASHSANAAGQRPTNSRAQTPLSPLPQQQPNQWYQRLVNLRPYMLGGIGAIGLYKLGQFAKNYVYDKFHRIPAYDNQYTISSYSQSHNTPMLASESHNKHNEVKRKRKQRQYQRHNNHHP